MRADKVILPGVGAFGDAMRLLTQYELPETIQSYIKELERICGCKISMLGVGPARDQVMSI